MVRSLATMSSHASNPVMYAQQLDAPAPIEQAPLRWRQAPTPQPGPGQLLIKVAACGVCRSNLHMIEGDWVGNGVPALSPIVPGHEVTGYVAELGTGVEGFRLGDRVGVQPLWSTCEECEFCTTGREQLCHERRITGEHVDGGYGELMVATARHTYHLPDTLDIVEAAPLFCPGITAFGAVDKLDLGPGDRVAVFGPGGVGHMAVQFAVLTGAEVTVVGRSPEHLAVARELGATHTVEATDPQALAQVEDTADAVLLFAPAEAVTAQALRTLKWGGTLVSAVPLTLRGYPFDRAQTLRTSLLGNRAQMENVLSLAAQGKVRTVVERFAMSQAPRALELLKAGQLRSRAVLEAAG
ncbi:zinc-binding alcohol dehydrogenase [Actinomyces lilanjuaniae]|uniref:alcohol dehydrogenase n=2 Tax=Actinomycetaceae TaxID=2049 RepID=A0ABM6Z3J2_9ACTO|nr:zinc-binding alcohol dehydrogenase [Actinomyces lilanjuaniae]